MYHQSSIRRPYIWQSFIIHGGGRASYAARFFEDHILNHWKSKHTDTVFLSNAPIYVNLTKMTLVHAPYIMGLLLEEWDIFFLNQAFVFSWHIYYSLLDSVITVKTTTHTPECSLDFA